MALRFLFRTFMQKARYMIGLRQWGLLIVFLWIVVGLDARAQRAEMGANHIPRAESAQPGSPHQTAEHTNHPEQAQNPVSFNGGHKTPTHQTTEELIRRADSLSGRAHQT